MSFLVKFQGFRLQNDEVKEVERLVNENRIIYESVSHFYRVAILKLIRSHNTSNERKNSLYE